MSARTKLGVLLTALLVALGVGLASAPQAAADDKSEDPAPIAGVNDEASKQNDFQKLRNGCQDFLKGPRDDAHSDSMLNKITTAPYRAWSAEACNEGAAILHPIGAGQAAAERVASHFWGDPIGKFVKALLEGNAQALSVLMSLWAKTPFEGASFADSVQGVYNLTYQLQFVLLAVSLCIAGARIAAARRRGLGEGFEDVAQVMTKFIIAGVALPAVVLSLHMATDAISAQWITAGSDGNPMDKITAVSKLDEKTGLGPALALLLVVFALLGTLMQFIALVMREAMLIVIVGVMPLAAASAATNTGKKTFSTMTSFVVAALLFKPIASLLYAVVFWLASGKEDASILEAIASMVLIGAAGFCMPALMRLLAPDVSSPISGGSAAAIGGAVGGATGSVAGGLDKAASGVSNMTSSSGGSSGGGYGGQYSAANGTVGPGGSGGSSGGGSGQPSGAAGGGGGGAASGAGGGQAAASGGSAMPSGAAGGASAASSGAGAGAAGSAGSAGTLAAAGGVASAVTGGVAAVALGAAAVAKGGMKASASTESMIAGALGNYHGQVH